MKTIEHIPLQEQSFMYYYRNASRESDFFHAHQGLEFLYIEQGEGQIILDGRIYPIQAQTLFIFQPYQLHKITVDPQANYIRTILVVDPIEILPFMKSLQSYQKWFERIWKYKWSNPCISLSTYAIQEMKRILANFQDRIQQSELNPKEELACTLLSIIQWLHKEEWIPTETALHKKGNSSQAYNRRELNHSERIMEWIGQHYHEPFSLDRLAQTLYLSPHHISHVFKDETGVTITEYLQARRLKEAYSLLTHTSVPIKEITVKLGLQSDAYFCQWFKVNSGMTPLKYRQHMIGK